MLQVRELQVRVLVQLRECVRVAWAWCVGAKDRGIVRCVQKVHVFRERAHRVSSISLTEGACNNVGLKVVWPSTAKKGPAAKRHLQFVELGPIYCFASFFEYWPG